MTDEEIAVIEQRCERATAGPWVSFVEGRDHFGGDSIIQTPHSDLNLLGGNAADQDFVATSREYVPALIAEIRRLRSLLGL
ncbi:hypothetical protein [Novosphingobium sp.]|uniref:hypothetical protein n=1 Tax=Novosphingobium sp. TaxID=1874826 RepID=UPI003BA8F0A3